MMDSCAGRFGKLLALTAAAMASQGCFSSGSGGSQPDASFDTGSSVDGFGETGDDASQPIDSGMGLDAGMDTATTVEAGHDAASEAGQDAAPEAGQEAGALTNAWTWVNGSNAISSTGTYGTLRMPAATNSPPAREAAASATGPSAKLWVFGGYSYVGASSNSYFNDLWRYDVTTGDWAWMAGSNTTGTVGVYPATVGTGGSASYYPGARSYATTWADASGNVWLFGGTDGTSFFNDLWKFDGTYWTWAGGSSAQNVKGTYGTLGTAASGNIPGARLLGTFGVDASGAFWLFGGYGVDGANNRGYLNDLWKYSGGQWTWVSGADVGDSPTASAVYGVFPATKGATGPTYVPGGRESACSWVDASGSFWVFGGWGYDGAGAQNYLSDLWKFDGTSWTWESGSNSANLPGVYGAPGVAALSNVPGARWNPLGWYAGGKLWMFSGSGDDSATTPGVLDDLWSYLP